MGDAWTANYRQITGDLDVDLRSNIAAEARAKIVYERLIDHTDDPGSIDALQFLMTREITIGMLKPTPGIVDEYFNGSTGNGNEGESDMRGPWTSSYGLHLVESQMTGGPGLSVGDIDGKIPGEDRGKQDSAARLRPLQARTLCSSRMGL